MEKRVKQKGRKEKGSFVGIPKAIVRSPQFRNLNGNETKVFLHLYSNYTGANNGYLAISYNKAKDYGLSRQTLSNTLKSLEDKGWIDKSRQGAKGVLSLYAVTIEPIDEVLRDGLPVHDLKPTITANHRWRDISSTK
ncbi:replication/maintenance protein RepL [Pasteurella multocida]|uniref:replication/maintenance protein RepL n=1 Tax=Pasteurella multocida TaxID=747 RepID=UPI003CF887D6